MARWAGPAGQVPRGCGALGRAVLMGKKKKRVCNANRNERSRGRSLLHGPDMGTAQNQSNSIEQWLAVGGGWQLAVCGGWRLVAVGGWWRLAVGGGWWQVAVGGGWRLVAGGGWRFYSLGGVLCGCPEWLP